MSEQSGFQEKPQAPEKTGDQLYEEWVQAYEEVCKLQEQIHELEMKKIGDDLTKEERLSIATECETLLVQLSEKREVEKKLHAQWEKALDDEMAEREKELKSLEEEIKN